MRKPNAGGWNWLCFVRAPKMTWLSYVDGKWLGFSMGSKLTWFCVPDENDLFSVWRSMALVFVWVVDIVLVSVCGPKMTWFCVGIQIGLVFCECRKWPDVSVGDRNWLDFIQRRDLKWLGFCLRVGNNLISVWIEVVFVSGHLKQLDFIGEVGISFDFVGDRSWLDFSKGIEIDFVFVRWVETDLVFVCGPKMTYC